MSAPPSALGKHTIYSHHDYPHRDKAPTPPPAAAQNEPPSEGTKYSEDAKKRVEEAETLRKALQLGEKKSLWEVLDQGRSKFHPRGRMNEFLVSISAITPEAAAKTFCETKYYRYLINLLPIHDALEKVQRECMTAPHLKEFVIPELFRSPGILRDIEVWNEFRDTKLDFPVSLVLRDHILEVGRKDPELIVAVMYTLYGTIMSGGQTNRTKVENKVQFLRELYDKGGNGSGVGLFELLKDQRMLLNEEFATFHSEWRRKLSEVELKLPSGTNVDEFHRKLIEEMGVVFSLLLQTIETAVEGKKC